MRAIAVFVVALLALSAGAFALQQTLYAEPPVQDLTPPVIASALPAVAAPVVQPAVSPGSNVPVVASGWLRRMATRAGIPEVALRAYARAELMAPRGCGLGWTTLAGIGWVESQHGTLGGRTVSVDGHPSSPILGPALDGVSFAAIPATPESTRLHGDPSWDHAMGPMQFIPSTWATWRSDGDGDGTRDPHDLDDAAFAAARYLCAGGQNLATGNGWTGSVLSYNHERVYLDAVHAAASAYADRTA